MTFKRILALAGVFLLAGLFITAIIMAVMGAPKNHLMAVIFSLVFIPVILYAMGLTARLLKSYRPEEGEQGDGEESGEKPDSKQ